MNFHWRADIICFCSSQLALKFKFNAHTQFGFVQYSEDHMMSGKDFRRNMETAWDLDGQYATDVFTNVSMDIIKSHNKSTPLFLYLAYSAVHAANVGKPLEVPQEIINKFSYISDPNRRTYAGKLEHFSNRLITPLSSVRHDDVVSVVCICTSNVKIIFYLHKILHYLCHIAESFLRSQQVVS